MRFSSLIRIVVIALTVSSSWECQAQLTKLNEFYWYVTPLASSGSSLYFEVDGDLWYTDGTSASTYLLNDFIPATKFVKSVVVGGEVYFYLQPGGFSDFQIWVSDGTTTGTLMLEDSLSGGGDIFAMNNMLYFSMWNWNNNTQEVWRIGGSGGSQVIATLPNPIDEIYFINGEVYLRTEIGSQNGLFKADDTFSNFTALRTVDTSSNCVISDVFPLSNGVMFFAYTTLNEGEVGFSDGTALGTKVIHDNFYKYNFSGDKVGHVLFQGAVYYIASDTLNNFGIYKADEQSVSANKIMTLPYMYAPYFKATDNVMFFENNYDQTVWSTIGTVGSALEIIPYLQDAFLYDIVTTNRYMFGLKWHENLVTIVYVNENTPENVQVYKSFPTIGSGYSMIASAGNSIYFSYPNGHSNLIDLYHLSDPTILSVGEENSNMMPEIAFPNPCRQQVQLITHNTELTRFNVCNSVGKRKKMTVQPMNSVIDVVDLSPGIYVIHWENVSGSGVARFVKY